MTNDLIAGRYELTERLGAGAFGEVFEARDRLSNRVVAVKRLRADAEPSAALVQLEMAALRQRLPGVVQLYDDGIENGRPYLVMERVQGEPFPGQRRPCAWADIADIAASLLDTLAHVHAGFVVHRDLKPENVLITPERHVKVLDFGLVHRTDAMAQRFTGDMEEFGTPAYRAPEQVRGSASERSDLYAVGVMLYEALAGRRPYDGATLSEILRAQKRGPVPLAAVAPGVPAAVARVVEELIAYDPEARPRSAAEVLHRLRGEASMETQHFSWLGPQDTLHALVRAARAGRSVDLVGPRGVGKTRSLRALCQVLGDERRVVSLAPSERAFGSLSPLVGPLAEYADRSLAEVSALVEAEVRQVLVGGAVLLADDAEQIDRASLAVLAACRDAGTTVRVRSTASLPGDGSADHGSLRALQDTLTMSPLCEEHLRELFAGPDRLLHLREDAARVLHLRTKGLPGRITEELATWLRLGVARWKRNLLVVHRAAIEALESGLLHAAPIDPGPVDVPGIPEALVDVLVWLILAWPHTDVALIARASRVPCFHLEMQLAALEEAGLIERRSDGRVELRIAVSAAHRWSEGRLRDAHDALGRVLPLGAPGRLVHLWERGARSDQERREIATEIAALGERLIDEGRLESAMAALESGFRDVRALGLLPTAEVVRLLALWVEAAVASGTPSALDRVLHEICRSEPKTEIVAHLEELCRAALGVREFSTAPLEHINQVRPFDDIRLERVRLDVRAKAARHLTDPSMQESVLHEIASAMPTADADTDAMLINFWGRLRYRQGRFREAAELHRRAADKARNPLLRTYSSTTGALACMDAFALDEARKLAHRAADDARALRHAYYETLAEWILRTIAYRLDDAGAPDIELVNASAFVGVKQLEGGILLNEAAVAWRRGERAQAADFAQSAYAIMAALNEEQSVILAGSLRIALGGDASDEEVADLRRRAEARLLPGIGLQALALLAMAERLQPGRVVAEHVRVLADAVPSEHWDTRMDLLSVKECQDVLARFTG
ncbi:protein kinase [Sorangium sp. So ce269]